jgi:hypothetical protein
MQILLALLYPFRTDDSDAHGSPTEDQRRAQYDHHAAEHRCWKVAVLASSECGGAGGARSQKKKTEPRSI